ncbi:uncharacterized protein EDB91DRAFT_1121039 [Suillus paluster]|uniref:uncharacterized protein n=1 Tax=Suillus paluster TaxID=48578 RepID=UPI001B87E1BC|nr:uncharacterized protein EDB91DRAFT_1121039 [Suillus paluster]KAG1745461.1 hypothetical protein EDB91DRAFT_1121039 [Suillus paluster]
MRRMPSVPVFGRIHAAEKDILEGMLIVAINTSCCSSLIRFVWACLHSFGLVYTPSRLHSSVLVFTRLSLPSFVWTCLHSFGLVCTRLHSSVLGFTRLGLPLFI